MIRRREDWEIRLGEALAADRRRAFVWGEWDCALFAADVVDAMCASSTAARWRGRYKTPKGAAGLLRRRGGIDREMARWGLAERPVLMAQRGDVVDLPVSSDAPLAGLMLGVCLGERVAAPAMPFGLHLMPLRRGLRAWHVPMADEPERAR